MTFSSVFQSCPTLCDPWTAAHQASLSITNSWSLLKLMSIESVMPSNHLILCCHLLLLPSILLTIRVFFNESVLHIKWPKTGVSASASVLPMNIQGWEGSPYHTDRKLGRCGFLKNEEKFPLPRRRKTGKPKVRG